MYKMAFPTEQILSDLKLFWQYPVITEETFYNQNKTDVNYLGFPWATVIDKKIEVKLLKNVLIKYIDPKLQYYTCCQHIYFERLFEMFKELNINTVYSPHKLKSKNVVNDINVIACPLYAANVEDSRRNQLFKPYDQKKLLEKDRKYLYSFNGAYNPNSYLTDIRPRIFKMKHPENCHVNCIGQWHYESLVYSKKQNKQKELDENKFHEENTQIYNKLLLDSKYSLCPSGSGPNSIRLWESLAIGSIPILLADTLDLPKHELWDKAIIRVQEKELETIPELLKSISKNEEEEMRKNCMKIYESFKHNFKTSVIDLFTSYIPELSENKEVTEIINEWKIKNPGCKIMYFSDKQVNKFFDQEFIEPEIKNAYTILKNGVAKADFFRIVYMYYNGGFWFDFDIKPFDVLKQVKEYCDLTFFDVGYQNISYMFIGSKPKNEFIHKLMHQISRNILENKTAHGNQIMKITGPHVLQKLLQSEIGDESIKLKDSEFPGTKKPKIYQNDKIAFSYKKLNIITKTEEYRKLQKTYNKQCFYYYNYI